MLILSAYLLFAIIIVAIAKPKSSKSTWILSIGLTLAFGAFMMLACYEFDNSNMYLPFSSVFGKILGYNILPMIICVFALFYSLEKMRVKQLGVIRVLPFPKSLLIAFFSTLGIGLFISEAKKHMEKDIKDYLHRTKYQEVENPEKGISDDEAVRNLKRTAEISKESLPIYDTEEGSKIIDVTFDEVSREMTIHKVIEGFTIDDFDSESLNNYVKDVKNNLIEKNNVSTDKMYFVAAKASVVHILKGSDGRVIYEIKIPIK